MTCTSRADAYFWDIIHYTIMAWQFETSHQWTISTQNAARVFRTRNPIYTERQLFFWTIVSCCAERQLNYATPAATMPSAKQNYDNEPSEDPYDRSWRGLPSPRSVSEFESATYLKQPNSPSSPRIPKGPRRIAPEQISKLRNRVDDFALAVLEATAAPASGVCDKYLDPISAWKIGAQLRPVRFGARFSAIWVRHRQSVVWFSVIEDDFIAFSLKDGKHLKIEQQDGSMPQITLPRKGTRLGAIHEALVEEFANDNHVRAIAAAVMLCTHPTGQFANVALELLPEQLRILKSSLCYDSPIDEDMITVLSDPKTTDQGKTMYLDCGAGYCAESTVNETMGRISRIPEPRKSAPFKESSAMLLPFVFQ